MPAYSHDSESWWLTLRPARNVLVMAPTMACASRLLDVAGLLRRDQRIGLDFTVPPHVHGRGTAALLGSLGVPLVPWKSAARRRYDLAITANLGGIAEVDAPVAIFAHGASRNKLFRPTGRGSRPVPGRVGSFSPSLLVQGGMLVPAALALGHDEELAMLAEECPEALPVATVVGDPCFDRLQSGALQRERYRRALGLRPGQKLVVVASTWCDDSLIATARHVLERVVAQLRTPEYRIAFLVHPNVYASHGVYQVRSWLEHLVSAGLVLVRPQQDWEPYVLAADYVVGDHGSVTLYAAGTGVPVLLGAFPEAEVHPRSGAAKLASVAPHFVDGVPMRDQLALAEELFDPRATAEIASCISSEPGGFARHTRRLLYGLLGLGQPATPAALAEALTRVQRLDRHGGRAHR